MAAKQGITMPPSPPVIALAEKIYVSMVGHPDFNFTSFTHSQVGTQAREGTRQKMFECAIDLAESFLTRIEKGQLALDYRD